MKLVQLNHIHQSKKTKAANRQQESVAQIHYTVKTLHLLLISIIDQSLQTLFIK